MINNYRATQVIIIQVYSKVYLILLCNIIITAPGKKEFLICVNYNQILLKAITFNILETFK